MKELILKPRSQGWSTLVADIRAATITSVADALHEIEAKAKEANYPVDHMAGMKVPKGGSNCAKCEYLADNKTDCTNKYFQKWNGSPVIPGPIDEYCSDWFETKPGIDAAEEKGWHGVDLDGTIADYTTFKGNTVIGDPIEGEALNRVRGWLKKGETVKIFTARADEPSAVKAIEKWCEKHLGQKLEVTNIKDPGMIDLLDDRAHRVRKNTGEIIAGGPGSGRHKGEGYRGFGGKYYQEYGFLDPYKHKILKGSSNGDHDLLARTRLQIRNKKGNESGVAVQNGYVRYIITPNHQAVFEHVGNESGHSAIKNFLLGRNDVKDVIMHVGKTDDDKQIEQLSKDELLNRYDDKGISAALEQSFGGEYKGTLWNGIRLVGFSGPEEETLRGMLSRIPPELLTYVHCFQSAKELNAKHGRYIDGKILFNPDNLSLRQHFGGGELAIGHADLTTVHEVGHSLFDHLSPEEKQAWEDISGWMEGTKEGQAPAYEERRSGWEPYTSKWTHKVGAKFPRYYAEKNPNEDFSDCFAFFLMNKAYRIGDEKKSYFENYMKAHVHRYPQLSIQSPIQAALEDVMDAVIKKVMGGNYAGSVESKGKQSPFRRNGKRLRHRQIGSKLRGRLSFGGEGSGCDEAVAESHGTSCGPKSKAKPYEKMKQKFEQYQTGQSKSKIAILGGIWPGGTAPVHIYKTMITGDWFSPAKLLETMNKSVLEKWAAKSTKEGEWSVEQRALSGIRRVGKAGQMFGQWSIAERTNPDTNQKEYRLVMNKVSDQARGQEGITDVQQHAALVAVQKLLGKDGLEKTASYKVLDDFAKELGLGDMQYIKSSVNSWVGTPLGKEAMYLKRVASDYYGRDWNKEFKGKFSPNTYADDKPNFKYNELKDQALAVKALSTEYVKAAGIQYLYRGASSAYADVGSNAEQGKAVQMPTNSLTGFSKNFNTAKTFAGSNGVVVRVKINPEDVWVAQGALSHLFGSYGYEKEYIVGFKSPTITLTPEDVMTPTHKPDWAK